MALVKCHECGKDVSTEAKVCPSCGAKVLKPKKVKKPTSPLVMFIVGAAGLGIVGVSVMNNQQNGNDPAKDEEAKALHQDVGLAEALCQLAFEKKAKNPESIEWLRAERQFHFTNAEKTKATSVQPVRAKNSFNATIKSVAECKLGKTDGKWALESIKEQH